MIGDKTLLPETWTELDALNHVIVSHSIHASNILTFHITPGISKLQSFKNNFQLINTSQWE